jgi:hypothetical protein
MAPSCPERRDSIVDRYPLVVHARVSSHEIGHILGLRHATDDAGRLMFSGTNGMSLTAQEIEVARYGAEGLVGGTLQMVRPGGRHGGADLGMLVERGSADR